MDAQDQHRRTSSDTEAGASSYDREYYATRCGPFPYDRSHPHWMQLFGRIADRIQVDIKPRTALDVGCAKGFLVEALRDRRIDAFGIDVSEFAIGEVRPDVRPYCRVSSAVAPFDGVYDLIVCMGVLEHLPEHEADIAIAHICASTSDVLFSSTPDDLTEPTHLTVRPRSFWIDRFARRGFYVDLEYDASFIAAHAQRFRRGQVTATALDRLLDQRDLMQARMAASMESRVELERIIATLSATNGDLRLERNTLVASDAAKQQVIDALNDLCRKFNEELEHLRARGADDARTIEDQQSRLAALRLHRHEAERLLGDLRAYLFLIHSTIGWKLLDRIRPLRDAVCPPGSRRHDAYVTLRHTAVALLDYGPRYILWSLGLSATDPRPANRVRALEGGLHDPYRFWLYRHALTDQDLAAMSRHMNQFMYCPRISVVMPVFNTPARILRRAIDSVLAQVYPYWELCLADDASTVPHVRRLLEGYASSDKRIRVTYGERNEGISGASASAFALARGEFVALLDHDDELSRDALFEVARRLNEDPSLELLYSDEDKLDAAGQRVDPFFKPDWSPDLLLSMNYIGHLAVLRRAAVEKAGGFRPGFDGSQDYDLFLRLTGQTAKVAHIPKVLYHWRKSPGSAAAGITAKPFALEAGRRALADALSARGLFGSVESESPGRYTVRYQLRSHPTVSIIIPTKDRSELLRQCLESIENNTKYPAYEILVIDNGSTDAETLSYLASLDGKRSVYRNTEPFNFSRLNNFGATKARGDHYLFLNNDTLIIDDQWLTAMVEHSQRPEVGAVGAKLLYPDSRIQHAGVVLGIGGVAGHAFKYLQNGAPSYYDFADVVRNVSAVTAACMMVPRRVFEELQGFDERLAVAFNDVEFCCRIRQRGYLIVYTPRALLYHLEAASRKKLHPPADEKMMWQLWGDTIRDGDPYYSPHLTRSHEDWRLGL